MNRRTQSHRDHEPQRATRSNVAPGALSPIAIAFPAAAVIVFALSWPGCGSSVCDTASTYVASCLGETVPLSASSSSSSSVGVGGSTGAVTTSVDTCEATDECTANCQNAASCDEIVNLYGATPTSASASLQTCIAGCQSGFMTTTTIASSSSSSTTSAGGAGGQGGAAGGAAGMGGAGGTGGVGGMAGAGGAAAGGAGGGGGGAAP